MFVDVIDEYEIRIWINESWIKLWCAGKFICELKINCKLKFCCEIVCLLKEVRRVFLNEKE